VARSLLLLALVAACTSDADPEVAAWDCEEQPLAAPDVNGVYRYEGSGPPYFLRGTITFEQTGATVRVLDTTYDNAADRALEGQGTLVGNRLDILLVPRNGDPDYEAEITFLFSPDGDFFCCAFSDTNSDAGPLGSYRGERQ
jgi:hypothetical protein